MKMIELRVIEKSDREQFIKDNQEAFNYGAMEEFGMRDDHFENENIPVKTIYEPNRDARLNELLKKYLWSSM